MPLSMPCKHTMTHAVMPQSFLTRLDYYKALTDSLCNAQAIAVVLSDGGLAAAECLEEDDWESAAKASESSNMPQNASEDTGCPALSMPLLQLLSAEEAAGIELTRTRWLSSISAASFNQSSPDIANVRSAALSSFLSCIVRNLPAGLALVAYV